MLDLKQNKKSDFESTAGQHADFIVKKLEQFIRNGRSPNEGMSFKKWQNMAKLEIAKSIIQAKRKHSKDEKLYSLMIFITASALTTVGFWGAAVSLGEADLFFAAAACFSAGLLLLAAAIFIKFRRYRERNKKEERVTRLLRIESLNKRIKKLERELEAEETDRKKQIEKIKKPFGSSLFDSLS